jgi:hypothetical protein
MSGDHVNPSVNSRRMQNLNALFGVAYREGRRFSVPQFGLLGLPMDKMIADSVEPDENFVFVDLPSGAT